jgi:hypothetical protein
LNTGSIALVQRGYEQGDPGGAEDHHGTHLGEHSDTDGEPRRG